MSQRHETRELSDEELRKIGVVVNPEYTYMLGIFPVKKYKVAKKEKEEEEGDGVATSEKEGIWFSGSTHKKRENTKRRGIPTRKQRTKRRYIKVAK
jgi:hypothetical protein